MWTVVTELVHPDPGNTAPGKPPGMVRLPSTSWTVVAALLPAAAAGVFYFGVPALVLFVLSTGGCMAIEAIFQRLRGREGTVSAGRAAFPTAGWRR